MNDILLTRQIAYSSYCLSTAGEHCCDRYILKLSVVMSVFFANISTQLEVTKPCRRGRFLLSINQSIYIAQQRHRF